MMMMMKKEDSRVRDQNSPWKVSDKETVIGNIKLVVMVSLTNNA
jgi:hypothetical protein